VYGYLTILSVPFHESAGLPTMHWKNITLGDVAQGLGNLVKDGREWLREHSPVLLNVEVNGDMLSRLWMAIAPAATYVAHALLPASVEEQDAVLLPAEELYLLPPAPALQEPEQKKPHWRRTGQVFAVLDQACTDARHSYSALIAHVREQTGKGCSRRVIANWKRQRGLMA
jgi:hypothetical protein